MKAQSHLFSEVSIATLPNHEICWNVPAYVAHSIKDIKQRQHLTFRAFQSATRSLNCLLAQWSQNVFEEKEGLPAAASDVNVLVA